MTSSVSYGAARGFAGVFVGLVACWTAGALFAPNASADDEFGLTIVTHGFDFGARLRPDSWPITMALAIRDRAGAGRVMWYDSDTGFYDLVDDTGGEGETVLVFDWTKDNNILADLFGDGEGYSEAAADAMLASLFLGQERGDFTIRNLHLISHSRGCVLMSEAAERLLLMGYGIEQMTFLDPHEWGTPLGLLVPGIHDALITDFDVNPEPLSSRGVVRWKGESADVGFVDVYYSRNGLDAVDGALDGRCVEGADYNLEITKRPNAVTTINHFAVHAWYHGTIDLDATSDEIQKIYALEYRPVLQTEDGALSNKIGIELGWYGAPFEDRAVDGFNQSRIAGGIRLVSTSSCGLSDMPTQIQNRDSGVPVAAETAPMINLKNEGIVNGDFERGPELLESSYPGWAGHGGGGTGTIRRKFRNKFLVLDGENMFRRHNRFYIYSDMTDIEFEYRITNSEEPDENGDVDFLQVSVVRATGDAGDEGYVLAQGTPIEADETTREFEKASINISELTERVVRLEFELVDGGKSTINSAFQIDNVRFSGGPNLSPMFECHGKTFVHDDTKSTHDAGLGDLVLFFLAFTALALVARTRVSSR